MHNLQTVYYQLFEEGVLVSAKTSFLSGEPTIGRFETRRLGPPRSIAVVKRVVAAVEDIDVSRITDVYITIDDEDPAGDDLKILRLPSKPGSAMDNPLAVIIAKAPAPRPVAQSRRSPATATLTGVSPPRPQRVAQSVTERSVAPPLPSLEEPVSSGPPEEPILQSSMEPNRVVNSQIPEGWRLGQVTEGMVYHQSHEIQVVLKRYRTLRILSQCAEDGNSGSILL